MKTFATFLLGLVIGCAAGAGYMGIQLRSALEKVTIAEARATPFSSKRKRRMNN